MKKFSKKKKIALSSVSVGLIAATLVTVFTLGANNDTYYSFEYIEKLKNKYQDSTMRILEVAPSGSESVFGYLVEGSEPNKDWLKVAQMFSTRTERKNYVNTEFNRLVNSGIAAEGADKAPLWLVSGYDELYPWEVEDKNDLPDGYKELTLDAYEKVEDVKGEMVYSVDEAGNGTGLYDSDAEYYLASLNYLNLFNFYTFKTNLSESVNELNREKAMSNASSKVLGVNPNNKSIAVYGSSAKNWDENSGYDSFYDLAAAYKVKDYYSFNVEPGKTYSLKFNATVTDGKGQISILPFDSNGKNIYYKPNYSKQYWYWSDYFDNTGANGIENNSFEYQFTVSPKSKAKKVQIRFDVSDITTVLKVNNIAVYQFSDEGDVFDFDGFNPDGNDVISLTSNDRAESKRTGDLIDCSPAANYTLTCHVEAKGGQNAIAKMHFYDLNKRNIPGSEKEIKTKNSGTYSLKFTTPVNAKYFALELISERGSQISCFSNISITRENYFKSESVAEYSQKYDHFSTGTPAEILSSTNVFDYDKWYSSGSNNSNEPLKAGSVISYNNGIIELDSGSNSSFSTKYTNGKYVQSDLLYYMAVDGGAKYKIRFRAYSNDETVAVPSGLKVTLHFSDESRKGLKNEKIFDVVNLDDDGFFTSDFIVPDNAHFAQISFSSTKANNNVGFDYIGIFEYESAKAFYYNLIFEPVDDPKAYPDGTPFYTRANENKQNQGFTSAGIYGEKELKELDENKTYYVYDDVNYRYVRATGHIAKGTELFLPGAYYYWAGNYNMGDFYTVLDEEYYIARINFNKHVRADEYNTVSGSPLYVMDGGALSADPVAIYTKDAAGKGNIDLSKNEYYLKVDPASDKWDELHPYYVEVEADGFTTDLRDGEEHLFVCNQNGYTYVGNGGHYNYVDNNKNNLSIRTKLTYYIGELKNNNWFKRFVLDCDRKNEEELEAEMSRFDVKVVVSTPDQLNSLGFSYLDDGETLDANCELAQSLDSFELVVLSSGVDLEHNKYGTYSKDISDDVLAYFKDRIVAQNEHDESYLPVIVDKNAFNTVAPKTNLDNLAAYISSMCKDKNGDAKNKTNHTDNGCVTDYIYIFDEKDIPGSKFIAGTGFITDIDSEQRSYEKDYCNYAEVYSAIDYENNLRDLKKKFKLFDDRVDEADIIRHILNYRGERVVNCKEEIRILEIQPATVNSVLCADGSKPIDVRKWFDPDGVANDLAYLYYDADGQKHDGKTAFTITTTTPYELNGKIDDLAELYDLVYIGTSLDNIGHLADGSSSTSKGAHTKQINEAGNPDNGDIVPDFRANGLTGLFYVSNGEKINTAGSGLNRPDLAGYTYDDYNEIAGLWWVNTSDCELRADGNDLTETKMEQLKMFIDQGLPVIVSDDLCLQDYSQSLAVKVMGRTLYEREGKEYYLPGFEGNPDYRFVADETSDKGSNNVCLTAQVVGNIPENTITDFEWFYHDYNTNQDKSIDKEETKKVKFLGITLWSREVTNEDYGKLDIKGGPEGKGGDGVWDTFYLDFDPAKYTENGYYYCKIKFDFSQCKNSLNSSLKYNGLYGEKPIEVFSNGLIVQKETRYYEIGIKGKPNVTKHEAVVFRIDNEQRKQLDKQSDNGSSHYYQEMLENGTITYENAFTPETAGDYVKYKWHYYFAEGWIFRWNDTDVQSKSRIYEYAPKWEDKAKNYRPVELEASINHLDELHAANLCPCNYGWPANSKLWHFKTQDIDGYRLALTDSNYNKIDNDVSGYVHLDYVKSEGGYNLNGTNTSGEDITGSVVTPNFGAKVLDNRVDTCSNMYELLARGFENNGNVFTQNQVERSDTRYRNLLKRYVNLSEPEIVYVDGEEPVSYPTMLGSRSFSFSFKVLNKTDVDSMNARYDYHFYVDVNGDGQFSEEELRDATVSGNSSIDEGLRTTCEAGGTYIYKLVYNFSKDEVGIKPWKLEVVKKGEPGAHTSVSDYAYIQPTDEPETIKAVMVLPSDWDPEYVRLVEHDSSEDVEIKGEEPTNSDDYFGNGKYKVLNGEKAKKGKSKYNGAYSGCIYKGSVFLNDVFVSDALKTVASVKDTNGNSEDINLTRKIYYCKDPASYVCINCGHTGVQWDPDDDGCPSCKEKDTMQTSNKSQRYNWEGDTPVSMNYDSYDANGYEGPYDYDPTKCVHHVEFTLGKDYKLEIYFTNVCDMDDSYAHSTTTGVLDDADMLIMGFGDMYCKQGQGKSYGVLTSISGGTGSAGVETQGFNQNASLVIEEFLDSGLPVLFCHDSVMYNCNFVNYAVNEGYGWFNSAANTVANWWTSTIDAIKDTWNNLWETGKLTYKREEVNKYNSEVHSSRLKQGYYSTLILRDGLGMDTYGITTKIKERAGYTYTDNGLKAGHSYNNIYEDTKKNGAIQSLVSAYKTSYGNITNKTVDDSHELIGLKYLDGSLIYNVDEHNAATNGNQYKYDDMNGNPSSAKIYNEWKRAYQALETSADREQFLNINNKYSVACNILDMEYKGYTVAWEPGTDKLTTTCYAQGFTTYAIKRFRKDSSDTYTTNRATQVNKGQITSYPYNLNGETITPYTEYTPKGDNANGYNSVSKAADNVVIKNTHEQYFQVNLNEDPMGEGATVWYCLAPSSSGGDKSVEFGSVRNDCKNAYYVYTNGNATYTGAGHTNTFSIFEAKLFLNTIVAASRSSTKIPKVKFYEKDGVTIQDYLILSGAKDEKTKLETSNDNVVDDRVFVSNGYVIWTDYLHFKISGASTSTDETNYRKVTFYTQEADGKAVDIPEGEIKIYADSSRKNKVSNQKIIPGVVYYMDIPQSLLSSMIDKNGTVVKGEETLYIHVDLTDEEKAELEKRQENVKSFRMKLQPGDSGYNANDEMTFYYKFTENSSGNDELYCWYEFEGNKFTYTDKLTSEKKDELVKRHEEEKYLFNDEVETFIGTLAPGERGYVEGGNNKVIVFYYFTDKNDIVCYYTVDGDKVMTDANGRTLYTAYYSDEYEENVYYYYKDDGTLQCYISGTEEKNDGQINGKYIQNVSTPKDFTPLKEQIVVPYIYKDEQIGKAKTNELGDAGIVISLTDLLYLR